MARRHPGSSAGAQETGVGGDRSAEWRHHMINALRMLHCRRTCWPRSLAAATWPSGGSARCRWLRVPSTVRRQLPLCRELTTEDRRLCPRRARRRRVPRGESRAARGHDGACRSLPPSLPASSSPLCAGRAAPASAALRASPRAARSASIAACLLTHRAAAEEVLAAVERGVDVIESA
jgi:hypothetical protein